MRLKQALTALSDANVGKSRIRYPGRQVVSDERLFFYHYVGSESRRKLLIEDAQDTRKSE